MLHAPKEVAVALTFYYGSGSPFAWKVWLALEHKEIAYDFVRIVFDRGEQRTPEYLAINPRGKVPAIVDGDVKLYESSAICEYLEDRYPNKPLLPHDIVERAQVRRACAESDAYFYPPLAKLLRQTLFRSTDDGDPAIIEAATAELSAELARAEAQLEGDFLRGELSLADFTLYPHVRSIGRLNQRKPQYRVALPPRVSAWIARIDALPYTAKTEPPHWK
jgi:glutathione S-transferase